MSTKQSSTAEEEFLIEIRNMTTGWALAGCKSQGEALLRIERMCVERERAVTNA